MHVDCRRLLNTQKLFKILWELCRLILTNLHSCCGFIGSIRVEKLSGWEEALMEAELKKRLLQSTWRDKNFNYRLNHLPKESMEGPVSDTQSCRAESLHHSDGSSIVGPPPTTSQPPHLHEPQQQHYKKILKVSNHKNLSEETACWELSNDFLTEASALSSAIKHNTQVEDTTPPKHKDLPKERV